MNRYLPAMLAAIISIVPAAFVKAADDPPGFATDAEEITRALSPKPAAKPKMRTRSLVVGSSPGQTTRAINVLAPEGGQTIPAPTEGPAESAGVNLKIEFDVDAADIRPASHGLLAELAKALQSETLRDRSMVIRGHTDSDGETNYNLALSLRRAQAVKDYLTRGFGIAADRLQVEGWGETRPLVPNDVPANKQINRRVEIVSLP